MRKQPKPPKNPEPIHVAVPAETADPESHRYLRVYLPESLLRSIKLRAAQEGRSLSALVRDMLRDGNARQA